MLEVSGGGGEEKKILLFRTLAVRHSGAGQPRVRSGKQMVAKQCLQWQLSVAEPMFCEFTEFDRPKGLRS